MNRHLPLTLIPILAVVGLAAACGSGSGSGDATTLPTALTPAATAPAPAPKTCEEQGLVTNNTGGCTVKAATPAPTTAPAPAPVAPAPTPPPPAPVTLPPTTVAPVDPFAAAYAAAGYEVPTAAGRAAIQKFCDAFDKNDPAAMTAVAQSSPEKQKSVSIGFSVLCPGNVSFVGTKPAQTSWTSGTYLVGTDVQPGTYRVLPTDGSIPHSYWARLDKSGNIIDNDLVEDGPSVVTIKASDFAIKVTGTLTKV
jgi:hypothetical protein